MSQPAEAGPPKTPSRGPLAAKTVISAIWLFGSRMLSRSIGIISTLILARVLMPSDFGIVAMTNTFYAIVDAVSQIGVQDALVRRGDNDRKLFDTAFTLQAGRSFISCAVLAALGPVAGWWFSEPRVIPMMFVLGATTLVTGLENVGISEFRRDMRYSMVFLLLSVPRVLSAAVAVAAALMLRSYWALLISGATYAVTRTTMSYIVHPYRPRFSLSGWRRLAGFSFWIWAASLATVLWDRIDVFVLGPVIGQARLGLYIISWELGSLPNTEIVTPAQDAVFAGFARAQKDATSSFHHAPQVASMLVAIVTPITITISCASGYIVAALLGPHWTAARPLVSIIAWLCLFSPLSAVCNSVLVANGHMKKGFLGRAVAALIKAAVLIVAAMISKRLDIIAAAMTICVAIESCGYLVLLKGLPNVRLRVMFGPLARTLLAGAAVVLVLNQLGLAWQDVRMSSAAAFVAVGMTGLLVTCLYALFMSVLWYVCGRPTGPETRFVELCGNFLRPVALRLWRR